MLKQIKPPPIKKHKTTFHIIRPEIHGQKTVTKMLIQKKTTPMKHKTTSHVIPPIRGEKMCKFWQN